MQCIVLYLAVEDHDAVVKVVVLHCGSGVELGKGRFNSTDGGKEDVGATKR